MIHESEYMILCTLESVSVWIAHAFVDFSSCFCVETYLQMKKNMENLFRKLNIGT